MMRVDFGSGEKQKEFFRKTKDNSTWKQLYELMIGKLDDPPTFRTFQNWYKGKYLPELNVVKVICDLTQQQFDQLDVRLKDGNWGQGEESKKMIRTHDCNLTTEDRIRGALSRWSKMEREMFSKIKNWLC